MMYIAPTGFMIANTKDSSEQWVWTTFGTGAGFTANLINAGTLLADRIAGGSLSSTDGSLKINLDSGHFTLESGGQKALDLYGNNIDFHDWANNADVIGSIASTHDNATGTSGMSLGVKKGCLLNIGTITANPDGGYTFTTLLGIDYTGESAKINMYNEAHVQGSLWAGDSQGWSGTTTIEGITMTYQKGIRIS